ncbi:DUF4446 family protein [Nocardiopsis coralli]|uniref:DUF4446 family protein n=1 Tax=Nocardiopsis coralli TaxID=2772213 RepID=UPI002E2DFE99|nr:DUF4446 family protein [Nocardiopsis coralli]
MVVFLVFLSLVTALAALAFAAVACARVRTLEGENRALLNRDFEVRSSGVDPRAVRDVAVVHYDALEEMSGARSFSVALLDGQGDGVVLTSINGRTEARTYAKAVIAGEGEVLLSTEEYRAVRSARLGYGPAGGTTGGAGTTRPRPAGTEEPVSVLSRSGHVPGEGRHTGGGE